MTDEALEDHMHALIKSKVPVFLPAGVIEYMTGRDDWSEICKGYEDQVTAELIAGLLKGSGDRGQEGFAAKKDGVVGIWIEKEYVSVSSDVEDIVVDVWESLDKAPKSEELITQAAFAAIELQGRHPEAQFHVTEGRDTWSTGGGRVCLSVFIPEHVVNKKSIIDDYYEAELPKLDIGIVKQVFGDIYEMLGQYFLSKTPEDQLKPKLG